MSKWSFRWGIDILDDGFIPVYRFMLKNYARLGLTRDEFLCIVHLASYHYETEQGESRPAYKTIAEQMAYKHENSIANLVHSLQDKGMLIITHRRGKSSVYDFAPFARRAMLLFMESQPPQSNVPVPPQSNVPVPPQSNVYEEEESKNKKQEDSAPQNGANLTPLKLALIEVCKIDDKHFTAWPVLMKIVKNLSRVNWSPDDLRAFTRWWYAHDWRGRKGQAPDYKSLPSLMATLNWRGGASQDAQPTDTRAADKVREIMRERKEQAER